MKAAVNRLFAIPRSLFWRISAAYLILILVTTLSITFIFAWAHKNYRDRLLQWNSWELAETFRAELLPLVGGEIIRDDIKKAIFRFEQLNPQVTIYLIDEKGEVINGFPFLRQDVFIDLAPIKQFLSHRGQLLMPIYGERPGPKYQRSVFSVAPLPFGEEQAYLYITLGTTKSEVLSDMIGQYAYIQGSIFTLVAAMIFSSVLGLLVFYLITRKFYLITTVIENFRAGNLGSRIKFESNDEIGLYARAFNEMADTIEETINSLKQQDQLRRSLITDISHDLRRPIAVSRTSLELMLEKQQSLSETEKFQHLERALASLDGLTSLMTDFFELSKLEAADYTSLQTEFSLSEIIDALILEYQQVATAAELEFTVEAPDGPLVCFGDSKLIHRTLSNLIENAIHYTAASGSVVLNVEQNNGRCDISVTDTGVGISESDLKKVFERFYRSEQAQAYNKRGTGLGLSIAKKAIEAHGAVLNVTSEVGKGTTFYFSLPAIDDSRR